MANRKIAIFDYKVVPTNAIGSCHLRILKQLCREYKFTVFAVEFDNPDPERIEWVRIPAPTRPLALLFIVYHLLAPLYYMFYRLRHGIRFDAIQVIESNLAFGDVAYVHFCHRHYLKHQFFPSGPKGLRGLLRFLDHQLHAWVEPWVFRRAKALVVVSNGGARELEREYPFVKSKLKVISNSVDVEQMSRPRDFDRLSFRRNLGVQDNDFVIVFAALGHFERKGLPLLMQAISRRGRQEVKLLVVGGEPDLVKTYRQQAGGLGIADQVIFTGMQQDVRPYLWCADAFALPSAYEVFSLIGLEAAAAGLPALITQLNGVEEYITPENGILVARTVESIEEGLEKLLTLTPGERTRMGENARASVQVYSSERFAAAWRDFYKTSNVA
ncbi:MAG: glycosyltransferase family 4 protein [Bryobacteraceae bacterium]